MPALALGCGRYPTSGQQRLKKSTDGLIIIVSKQSPNLPISQSPNLPTSQPPNLPTSQSPHPLLPLLGYLLLTILMTWPTVRHLAAGIPGDGFDGWQNYWNLWWVREAILVLGQHPFVTGYLYPPQGTNLLFHTLNIFNGLWTLPLQLNFGLAIAYNSVVFFSFVFAGYGGYLLSLYTLSQLRSPTFTLTGGRRLAAFAGGLVFTMSPFHLAHLLGHMQVFSMVWPPFYILWLLRTLQPWQPTVPPLDRRNIALTSLFLILATAVDWYHTLYLLLVTGLVLIWKLWHLFRLRRQAATLLRPLLITALIGLGFAILLSPLLVPMILEASNRPDLETGLAQNITLSADLLAFFLPSEMHPLWGEWATGIANNFTTTTSERLIFAGFVPLALTAYILIRAWRQPIVRFWGLVALLFFLLALGPYLHINGQMVTLGEQPLPLPYLLLYHTIPFIDLTRSLSRYDLMVMLALGVLVSIALNHISSLISRGPRLERGDPRTTDHRPRTTDYGPRFSTLPPLLAILLICFEFLPLPYPISRLEIPQFYYDIAADEPYVVAELPMNWDRPTPLLHQTIHGKPLLTAYTSRDNPRELVRRLPVFQQWRSLGPDILDQPLDRIAPTLFFDFNLRYIILDYWQMPPGPEREATEKWVAAALPDVAPVYDDGRLKVYQSPPQTETQPYLSLGNGWGERQESERGVSRTISGAEPAELFLHHPQERTLRLEITAAAKESSVPLTLTATDHPLATFDLGPDFSTHTILLPSFNLDLIRLELETLESIEVIIRTISLHEENDTPQTS